LRKICLCLVLCLSGAALAQDAPAVKHSNWNLGIFAIGGTGLNQDSDIHMFGIGGRLGRVLTNEHGPGVFRGTLEWNAEVLPFYQFYSPGETATGAVINPLVAKYNFTRGRKLVPFFEAVGGAIFTPPRSISTPAQEWDSTCSLETTVPSHSTCGHCISQTPPSATTTRA
jgi:hypothetical protein